MTTVPLGEGEPRYHPRRLDKEMPDWADQLDVLRTQSVATLAMARGDEPYLVTMNVAYDEGERCFYAHAATTGKKMEFLRVNPRVWGQVVEDGGPVAGKCTQKYRSVMFEGTVEEVTEPERKLRAMERLIEKFEPDPTASKARMLTQGAMDRTTVLCIRVHQFSGKRSPAEGD